MQKQKRSALEQPAIERGTRTAHPSEVDETLDEIRSAAASVNVAGEAVAVAKDVLNYQQPWSRRAMPRARCPGGRGGIGGSAAAVASEGLRAQHRALTWYKVLGEVRRLAEASSKPAPAVAKQSAPVDKSDENIAPQTNSAAPAVSEPISNVVPTETISEP